MPDSISNKNANYYKLHSREITEQTRALICELPKCCEAYFRAISTHTSALTRLNYATDLRLFFDFLSADKLNNIPIRDISLSHIDSITTIDIEKFIDSVTLHKREHEYASKTVVFTEENGEKGKARKLSAIRSMLKYFYKKEMISSNPASLVDNPKIHEKAIVRLEGDEVEDLLNQVESGDMLTERQQKLHKNMQVRDLAIITLLLGTGIRVSECIGLNLTDINFDENSILITRKGGNEVVLYLSDEVADVLKKYYYERVEIEAADPEDASALFLSSQRKRIQQRSVQYLVKKYSKVVTPLKRITPHKLRSTYGTNLYRQSGDIYLVADVLGHKDVNTTKRHYAAITEDRRKDASQMLTLRKNKNSDGEK